MILHSERMQDVQTLAVRRQADRHHAFDPQDRIVLRAIGWLSIGWVFGSLATMLVQALP